MISDDLLKNAVLEAYAILAEHMGEEDPGTEEMQRQQDVSGAIDDEGIRVNSLSKKDSEEVEEDDEEETDEPTDLVKGKKDKEEDKFSYDIPDEVPNNVAFKDVMAQLNFVRSGASTKDDEVKQGLLKYFENLDGDEKRNLFSMLSGFATIMNKAGDVEDAPMPGKEKASKGSGDIKKKPIKKLSNAPIVVGEIATKYREYLMVMENSGEKHRCTDSRIVPFGSESCVKDIEHRIEDSRISRDSCASRSEQRVHHNGLLKYLRMQLRAAQKINGSSSNS